MAERPALEVSASEIEGPLREIDSEIARALNELLRRSHEGGGKPEIADRKSDYPPTGTVQNCEFGLALLAAHKWLKQRNRLEGEIGDEAKVVDVIVYLLQEGVSRLTEVSIELKGGELSGSPVFFRGDPYTTVFVRRGDVYVSANLDAAMLILAFFAGALEVYDQVISSVELDSANVLRGSGLRTLRDAGLLVCKEALRYAISCRIETDGQFQGFSCDPSSAKQDLLSNQDRLFFTWTTCETLHELLEFSDWIAYLERVLPQLAEPKLATETRDLLLALEHDLSRASDWCRRTFLDEFRKLEAPQIDAVVRAFSPLGDTGQPNSDLAAKAASVGDYVRNVYSIAQYAAIRSIAPTGITIPEVRDILDRLQVLVETHILGSGLDEARHRSLYVTLTRYYSLGNASKKEYEDDAYFPLVVRSLAGLLTRTVALLGESETRESILLLVADFRRSLQNLCQKMIARRPADKDTESGDEYLWTTASSRPFLLYATQRTIFALLAYKDFLCEMERYKSSPASPGRPSASLEEQLRDALARSLADVLLAPVVELFVRQARLLPTPSRTPGLDRSGRGDIPQSALPQTPWIQEILLKWLRGFSEECDSQIQSALLQDASCLIELRSKLQSADKNAPAGKLTGDMQRVMDNLLAVESLRALNEAGKWEEDSLMKALFEHLLQATLPQSPVRDRMLEIPLWTTIRDAKAKIEAHNRKQDNRR